MQPVVNALSSIPAAAYAALAAALLAALVTLLGVALTNRANNERLRLQLAHDASTKEKAFRREKLEELYLLVEGWTVALVVYHLTFVKVMRGELTYNQALDLTIASGRDRSVDYKRLEMIVDLYFVELRPDLDLVLSGREDADKIITAHKKRYKTGDLDGAQFVKPLLAAVKNIEAHAVALKGRITEMARRP